MTAIKKLFLLLALVGTPGAVPAQEKPNMIIFIGDDISYNDFGCYGHPVIKTPNIDRLARNGLRFTNAFLTASSCSPSRNSIITGRYPHNTGAAELHSHLPDNQIPFPRLLKEAGYYTGQAGKWHFGPFPPNPGDAMHGAFDRIGGHAGDGGGPSGSEKWLAYIEQRPSDKPFFMWFAALDAHRDWDADSAPFEYEPDDVVIPPYWRDTPETREDVAAYYREVSRFDHFIGKVVSALERQNVLQNTIILVMADNGRPFPGNKTRMYDEGIKTPLVVHWPDGIRKKGQVSTSLVSAIDIAPTLLHLADVARPEAIQGRSFKKLLQNPRQKFRNVVFAEHNWHDFMAFERMVRTERFLYIENGLPHQDNRGAIDVMGGGTGKALQRGLDDNTLTDVQMRIFLNPQPAKEFYDCRTDTLQLNNLSGTGRAEERNLAQVLAQWKVRTGDSQPANLTRDWYDRVTNAPLDEKEKRGSMPGADRNAHMILDPGPF